MTQTMLYVHIFGGYIAVIAGYAALFSKKGGWLHRRAGLIFVTGILIMGAGAVYVGLVKDLFTWTGGITTPYFAITSLITVRRKGEPNRLLEGALMLIPIGFGLNAIRGGIAVWALPGHQLQGVPAAMMFISGGLLLMAAAGDLRILLRGPLEGTQRLARHLWRMLWAMFAATGSFFLIAKRVPEPIRWAPLRLVLAFLPLVMLFFWLWKVRRRSASAIGARSVSTSMENRVMKSIAVVVLALLPGVAGAQLSSVQTGERVRVWIPEPWLQHDQTPWRRQLLRGTVASTTGDTLHLTVPGTEGTLSVARSSITRLDVSRGRPSRGASAIERAFSGAIVGAISVALRNDPYGRKWPNYSRHWRAAEEGAKWGAAFGAVLGFTFPTERWRRVRLGH
jgi:hypothetical protein